ncbi:ORF MSV102 hypothetical protein [Melanoplus sanguinipes entomopoxvirus]|uniref:Uncharacterized protein n=1 Tax=Melanoplus sanguinipes entomopoxvirus TaxID=83191 RepID=Q9YVZ0_MSEPV|nr:ORF MSV102 hypothetical protein [Melanoplus sanguinipes entomopoxvirus]AAC97649.1 ORF MSV102 hypothetical protein [Melanoplus sanguinipes entomopoxvirus 'O']
MSFYNYFEILFDIELEKYLFNENDIFYFITKNTNKKIILPIYLEKFIEYENYLYNCGYKIYNIYDDKQELCINVFKKSLIHIYIYELLIGFRLSIYDSISPYIYVINEYMLCEISNNKQNYNIYLNNYFNDYLHNFDLIFCKNIIIINPTVNNYKKALNFYFLDKKNNLKRKIELLF